MYITMITIASSYVQCYDNSFIVSETILYSHYITHTLYRVCQTLCKKSHIFNVHILYSIILHPVYNTFTYKCMSHTTLHPLYNVSLGFICNRYCISCNDFSLFLCFFNDDDSLSLSCVYTVCTCTCMCVCMRVYLLRFILLVVVYFALSVHALLNTCLNLHL